MATTTSMIGLTKPAVSEAADISVINNNFDLIDAFIKGTGLGRGGYGVDTLDNATTFGLYLSNVGVPPIEGQVYWTCLVLPHNTTATIVQIAYRSTSNPTSFATRRMTNSVWGEWEYINPPMQPGVEYRTTERWEGKPVYRKYVSYVTTNQGEDGKVTGINIPHGISGMENIIRCVGKIGAYFLPYMSTSGGLTMVSQYTSTNIMVRTNGTWANERTWHFDLAYTKA